MELSFPRFEQYEDIIECSDILSAVLWINESKRDYVVAWGYKRNILFSYKKHGERIFKAQNVTIWVLTFKDNKALCVYY